MTGFINEFKTFILKGNAIDLAVGIIIGAAFGAVVSSLVADVMMPPLGYVLGNVDFSNLVVVLKEKIPAATQPNGTMSKEIPEVAIRYGKFINSIIALLIQGFAIFLVVKGINALRRKPDPTPATPAELPADIKLLTEIRDSLRGNSTKSDTNLL